MDKKALVSGMKTQTFGVEVEMNGITRDAAARVANRYFGGIPSDVRYEGTGYKTWVCMDRQRRTWKFMRDSSIGGPDDERCEMVTPILHYEDLPLLQGLIRELRHSGAKSCPSRGCGVHIHVGADGHTPQTLRNLVNIMAKHEDLLIGMVGIPDSRLRQWCKVVDPNFLAKLNQVKPDTMAQLADIWYKTQHADGGRYTHYNLSRYHMLNLHATFTKGTIEFRLFQFDEPGNGKKGGLHAGQLKAYIQLCLAMSQLAKMLTRASAKKTTSAHDNPCFAMRGFLHQMGLTGEEFDTLRKMVVNRLPGDCNRPYNREAD